MNGLSLANKTPLMPSLLRWKRWAGDQSHALPQGELGGCSATGATWFLPSLRTDSVSRGFCISLLTLTIVVLARLIGFILFFFIPPY
jgi:hypothetical protein